jgi:hypothetical protein
MATVEYVGVFLARLGMLCPSNMSEDEALSRIEEYTPLLCREYSDDLFRSEDCMAYVAKRCKFFPGYGELCGHLADWIRDFQPIRLALPAPPIERRVPATAEEIAVIAALTRQAVQVCADAAPPPVERMPAKAVHLSDGQLLAQYERLAKEGNTASAVRAQTLRAKMADAEKRGPS